MTTTAHILTLSCENRPGIVASVSAAIANHAGDIAEAAQFDNGLIGRFREIIEASGAQFIVLARYMPVLSDGFFGWLSGRCINIHHSFLPSFKGAKPYHQPFERGVKMIAATAHYVTVDLDEGPIITQDVEHFSQADTPEDMVCKGRDIERRGQARAVALHIEGGVLLNGRKTVVFA